MKLKQLIIVLAVGLIALMIGTGLLSNKHGEQEFEQSLLLADVDLSQLSSIEISNAGKSVKVEKLLGQWQVASKGGYPADKSTLSTLIQALKDAEIVELKTKQAKNHHRLGLVVSGSDNSSTQGDESFGTLVNLNVGAESHQLVVGKTGANNGSYVRFLSEPQTYLIDQVINLPLLGADWIDSQVLDLDYDAVNRVSVSFEAGESFVIQRPTGSANRNIGEDVISEFTDLQEFVLDSASNNNEVVDKELQYSSILSGLVRNILSLEAADVSVISDASAELGVPDNGLNNSTGKTLVARIGLSLVDGRESELLIFKQLTAQTGEMTADKSEASTEQTSYFANMNGSAYLLSISEFYYKQLTKPLVEYYQGIEP